MEKKAFLFFALCMAVVCAKAQNWEDVVYLKNGSIIKGTIVEQIPNVSLKIQTGDGSIFAYGLDEVEKITKEQAAGRNKRIGAGWRKNGNGLETGYRGFFDFGGTIGTGTFDDNRVELSTSHGIQISPHFFLGVGAGYNHYSGLELHEIPVFGHVRSEFLDKFVSPFIDIKIGYTVFDEMGFYMNPSVGCRIALPRKTGLSFSVGYTMQKFDIYYYDDNGDFWGEWKENFGGVSMKVSVDF